MTASAPSRPRPDTRLSYLSDEALVELAQAGDDRAFGELAGRYASRLRWVLFSVAHDREIASEAVQEALTRAWQNIDRFEGRSSFYTWLTRIGVNEIYRIVRSRREEPLDPNDLVGRPVPNWGSLPDEVFESREFLGAVVRGLNELQPEYQDAVRLRDVQGLSTSEAAKALGIGERALKSRLHRGRMALRAMLDDYFDEG